MNTPKFIRKMILKAIGSQTPMPTVQPFPRESLIGFSEKEIDELVLGRSYENILSLKEIILEEMSIALPQKEQRKAVEKKIDRFFQVFIKEESQIRNPLKHNDISHMDY